MIGFLRKLWKDRRGNALVIVGAGLPVLVGAAGLATDTIQWTLWKRQLQRAADSAALAAAYAKAQGQSETAGTCSTAATPAVSYDLTQNNHLGITTNCSVATPVTWTGATADANAFTVTLSAQKTLGFSSLFVKTAPTITVKATATMIDSGSYCLVALNNTSTAGITLGGNSHATLGCGAISNSTSSNDSVDTNGTSYSFSATTIASVGGMPSSVIGCNDTTANASTCSLNPDSIAEPDPYSSLSSSMSDSGMNCKNMNSQMTGNANKGYSLSPGCYTDFSFSGNSSYTLASGTYYLDNTNFSATGNVTIQGTGVTIILTGTSPGSISLNGNTTIKLSAPTSGTLKNMLIMQSGTGLSSSNANDTIDGTAGSYFDGAVYAPAGNVTFGGTSGTSSQCTMVVGWTVSFSGTSGLQNSQTRPDGSACTNATQVSGKRIRLVA